MASSDGGSEGDNGAGTYQQLEVPVRISEGTMEETMVTTTDSAARSIDISILHDYAMDHLFSFLPLSDLKNCRLVNRSWNRASNRAILTRDHVINFPEYRYAPRLEVYGIEDIPKLVQLIRTSFQFPWTKFIVEARYMTTANKKRQLNSLLSAISPFVTEIEIRDFQSLQALEYPNLRKLNLWYDSSEAPVKANQKSLLRMVERASKLDEINITGSFKPPLFMDILNTSNCRKITRLTLLWCMEGEHLVRISEMGFQLKYLHLAFYLTKITAESVSSVLQSQSPYVEELELTCDEDYPEPDEKIDPQRLLGMECPRMEKLKVLTVQSVNVFSRISYKDQFPALKKLKFYAHDPYLEDNFFNDDIEPVETVQYLKFGNWLRSRYPERILQAARQFPKLRSVYLIVGRNHLHILGHALPQLEEMELSFNQGDDMDVVLTGFSSEEVETLKSLPSSQLDMLERSKEPANFLKSLKRLRLSSTQSGRGQTTLSDFGCRFALLKMENLRVLELKGNFSQISDQVMERMRKMFVVRLIKR